MLGRFDVRVNSGKCCLLSIHKHMWDFRNWMLHFKAAPLNCTVTCTSKLKEVEKVQYSTRLLIKSRFNYCSLFSENLFFFFGEIILEKLTITLISARRTNYSVLF